MMGLLYMLPRPLQGERAGERGPERRAASVSATMFLANSPLSLTTLCVVCPSPPEGGEGMGSVR